MMLESHISNLVILQQKLLREFYQLIDPDLINSQGDLSIFAKKAIKSKTIRIDGENWTIGFHGVGACFTRESDKVVVDFDKHLNKPNCFSPWRLSLYLESIGIDEDHNKLKSLLDISSLNKVENDRYELSLSNVS